MTTPECDVVSPNVPTIRHDLCTLAPYLIAFLLPCIALLCGLLSLGMYPFGDETFVTSDLRLQYLDLLNWLKDCLSGNGSIFYSFSKSLGGNMFATWSYYLASPFNLLLALVDENGLIGCVVAIVALKCGSMGCTGYFYLRHRFGIPVPFSLALGVGYALMSYVTTQITNLMWLDVVIMLPLVAYGIWHLMETGRTTWLFTTLLITIVLCWYTGYMATLFCILYYLFECLIRPRGTDGRNLSPSSGKSKVLVRPLRFSVTSSLAIITSLVILLPTIYAILLGKGTDFNGFSDPSFYYSLPAVVSGFFLGVCERGYVVQIYCGTLALLSMVGYLVSAKTPLREKTVFCVTLAVLILMTWLSPLDSIWTGFQKGTGYFCRWSFVISFFVLFAAARFVERFDASCRRDIIKAAIIVAASSALGSLVFRLLYVTGITNKEHSIAPLYVALTCLLASFFSVALLGGAVDRSAPRHRWLPRLLACMVIVCATTEAVVGVDQVLHRIDWEKDLVVTQSVSSYLEYYDEGVAQIAQIERTYPNDSPYRVDKTYNLAAQKTGALVKNEGFTFGYHPISQYVSTNDERVCAFLDAMGYSSGVSFSTSFKNAILPIDSILGLRFVSSDTCPDGYTDAGLTSMQSGNRMFVNGSALPLGFGVARSALEASAPTDNLFANQESFVSSLIGTAANLYRNVEVQKTDSSVDSVTYRVNVPARSIVYFYLSPQRLGRASLLVDGTPIASYFGPFSQAMYSISGDKTASEHTIQLTHSSIDTSSITLEARALDQTALSRALAKLSERPLAFTVFQDGHVSGTYESDDDGLLMCTIPYDAGWTVRINGESVTPKIAWGTFLAIPITAGMNHIEMRYVSPWFIYGICAGSTGLVCYLAMLVIWRRRDHQTTG